MTLNGSSYTLNPNPSANYSGHTFLVASSTAACPQRPRCGPRIAPLPPCSAYESGLLTEAETVRHTAAHLGMAVTQAQAKTIFPANHRTEVEKYIARMPSQPGVPRAETFDDLLPADPVAQLSCRMQRPHRALAHGAHRCPSEAVSGGRGALFLT